MIDLKYAEINDKSELKAFICVGKAKDFKKRKELRETLK